MSDVLADALQKLTPAKRRKIEAWFAIRPPKVAAVMRAYPPLICYRSTENDGHYWIQSYGEPRDDGPITLTLAHGQDSYLPGVGVFGVAPETLTPCNCGRWSWPTPEQAEETAAKIEVVRACRKGGPNVG